MQHELLNTIYKPASVAGLLSTSPSPQRAERLRDAFIRMTYLYGASSPQVLKCLLDDDEAAATEALDRLQKERLIKVIACDQQRSGQLIKLAPGGLDYAEAILGETRGRKYDSSSRISRKSLVRHDISSQLYVCRVLLRYGNVRYLPEAAMAESRKTKYFDIIMMLESGRLVGVEIERTSKFGEELLSTIARAIRAIRAGDVDFVVFVLPTAGAADRYDRVLDAESLFVSCKKGRRWMQHDTIDLTSDDLMRIGCVVGDSSIWKGAM